MRNNYYKNKVCLVIGAGGGVGSGLARKLTDFGAVVIKASKNSGHLVDITSSKSICYLKRWVKRKHNKIDFIFNASGIACYKPLSKTTNQEINSVLDVNLIGPILLTRCFFDLMSDNGYMVHIGSVAGITIGHKFFSIYSASKEGLAGFLRSAAAEYQNINFILVTPSGINTRLPNKSYGSNMLIKKFNRSKLDSVEDVCNGILNNIEYFDNTRDIRLFPTKLSRDIYEKITK